MAANPEVVVTTKPKLRLRIRQSPRTEFDKLIDEAIRVTREVNAKSTPQAYRLTAKAFERELLEVSGADGGTKLRINKLQQDIDTNHAGLDHTRASLRQMMTWLKNRNWSQVPRDLRRYDFLSTESARTELSRRQLATHDLIIIAARYMAKRSPEIFGSCQDSAAHAAELADLKKNQAELFARANQAWAREDLEFGEIDRRTGLAPAWFRRSNRRVPTSPPEDAAKRLVDHIVATEKG